MFTSLVTDCACAMLLFIEIAHAQCYYSSRLRMRNAVIHRDCACAMLLFVEIAHAQCCYSSRLSMRNAVIHRDCACAMLLFIEIAPVQCCYSSRLRNRLFFAAGYSSTVLVLFRLSSTKLQFIYFLLWENK